jgi:hypothetical protein
VRQAVAIGAVGLLVGGASLCSGGMSVVGLFIQTLTMVDVTTDWTEYLPLMVREGMLVEVQPADQSRKQDSALMNDIGVAWSRTRRATTPC